MGNIADFPPGSNRAYLIQIPVLKTAGEQALPSAESVILWLSGWLNRNDLHRPRAGRKSCIAHPNSCNERPKCCNGLSQYLQSLSAVLQGRPTVKIFHSTVQHEAKAGANPR